MTKEYIEGRGRGNECYDLPDETHLYKGSYANPGLPMCVRGWNRDWGTSYSIFRGCVGKLGVCQVCERRAEKGLPGIDSKYPRKLKKHLKKTRRYNSRIPYSPLRPGIPLAITRETFPGFFEKQEIDDEPGEIEIEAQELCHSRAN